MAVEHVDPISYAAPEIIQTDQLKSLIYQDTHEKLCHPARLQHNNIGAVYTTLPVDLMAFHSVGVLVACLKMFVLKGLIDNGSSVERNNSS